MENRMGLREKSEGESFQIMVGGSSSKEAGTGKWKKR